METRRTETSEGAAEQGRPNAGAPRGRLPEVLPEELADLAVNWDRLIAGIPPRERFAKICLQKAHPTVTEEGQLLVVFENFLEADYFMGKESADNARFFSEYLAQKTGKSIPVRYKFLDKGRKFSDNYQDLRSAVDTEAIHMEIEEDED